MDFGIKYMAKNNELLGLCAIGYWCWGSAIGFV